ncbi:LPS export ABC transporter permease LptG [Marinomonas sp. 2405UD68-3]|uniref:LPS export ABC transporter permease LptG n=1 Tax=Marinomonas sp. 2405UD68-3 TaxID=3391835 RepID=UPI0039C8F450
MNKLDRHIGSSVFWSFLTVILVLLGMDFVLTFIDQVKKVNDSFPLESLLQVLVFRLPGRFTEYIPIASLIGTLAGLGALASNSELTIMRAAGIPLWRIGYSAIQPVLLISAVGMAITEYVAPEARQKADLIEKLQNQQNNQFSLTGGVWIRSEDKFVYINAADKNGTLYGVQIFTPDGHKLSNIRKANTATHKSDNQWELQTTSTTHFLESTVETYQENTSTWATSLKPEHLFLAAQEPESLSLSQSLQYQTYLKQQGLDSGTYQLEFWGKALSPLASIALVIVALSTVFGPLRSSTMGGRIFSGVMIGLVFQNALSLFGRISLTVGFSPLIGVLIPIAICFLFGLILMKRVN